MSHLTRPVMRAGKDRWLRVDIDYVPRNREGKRKTSNNMEEKNSMVRVRAVWRNEWQDGEKGPSKLEIRILFSGTFGFFCLLKV